MKQTLAWLETIRKQGREGGAGLLRGKAGGYRHDVTEEVMFRQRPKGDEGMSWERSDRKVFRQRECHMQRP